MGELDPVQLYREALGVKYIMGGFPGIYGLVPLDKSEEMVRVLRANGIPDPWLQQWSRTRPADSPELIRLIASHTDPNVIYAAALELGLSAILAENESPEHPLPTELKFKELNK